MQQKEFACRDVGIDCDFRVQGETEDELLNKAEMHGQEAHGMKELSEDIRQKIRSAIHDMPTEQRDQAKIA